MRPWLAGDEVGVAMIGGRWLLVAVCGLIAAPLAAAVNETLTFDYYQVTVDEEQGEDPRLLLRALQAASPFNDGDQIYGGQTAWTVTPSYGLLQEAEGCRLVEPEVALTIVISLPQLADGSSERASQQFATLYQPLLAHEQIHAELGRRAAAAIDQLLTNSELAADCAEADSDLMAAMEQQLAFWGGQNQELDRLTSHGLHPENYQLPGD